ncbi:2-succinyl-5-enolpyruvyl-6-hydroxy-3-cyclohexene-1-carboxylic-acid synthase [Sanyastnella coralliicola]|uniref:2-succinyl-5-enolpyruvyl-6-hydroxy-3- cyclohexene-1-carboxylic-acid synthase n=1 Tax=Sanyastnella coralliicola TaxID=3069118 RepID=UPI0027B975F6|nr:2-succinyl-5-enolpyruvyl-6-hydroxy-3-cyclohexene-1-carboxylic-acid synthase [Longitalea sp. SCSIO 12813]
MISDKPVIQDLIGIVSAHGIQHVVISPGSRHAPVSLSFYHHPEISCHIIPDERAAGYFALGLAQELQQAVGIVCTSGTAAANYGPAMAEAHYQDLPLVFMSTDRPEEWVDQGDGQTIRQQGLLDLHARKSIQLRQDDDHADVKWHNQRMINEAMLTALGRVRGPVHINIPLREPLYELVEFPDSQPNVIQRKPSEAHLTESQKIQLKEQLAGFQKIMIITGHHLPNPDLTKAVAAIANRENVVVLTETTSNCTQGEVISCIDRLLMTLENGEHDGFAPDLLVTFGSQIISKKIKAFLRQTPLKGHWHIDEDGRIMDTFKQLSEVLSCGPSEFFRVLASAESVTSDYHAKWYDRHVKLEAIQQSIAEESGWSDLQVFKDVLPALPQDSILQMGNSSVVRYIQLFEQRSDILYYGNRGTSGIDGCTSTAAGMAVATDKVVTLISGDISFLYDVNGLWHQQDISNLKIVLINNGGGNIFRIIDGPSSTAALEEVFETRHAQDASHLAKHFGIEYISASDRTELKQGIESLYASEQCAILEVFTRDVASDEVLKQAFRTSKKRIKI